MSDLDRYDVEYMIRDAVSSLCSQLRGEIDDLRVLLRGETREDCGELQRQIDSLERTLNSRTEHLV